MVLMAALFFFKALGDTILALLCRERGAHFDPASGDLFFENTDTIQAIRKRLAGWRLLCF